MNSVQHEWWKARDVSSLSRSTKVEISIHEIPVVVTGNWNNQRRSSLSIQLLQGQGSWMLLRALYRSSGSSAHRYKRKTDLLHCVAWRLHPQIASHQVYGNTRQNKIQSSLGCLCRDSGHACAMSACRESPGWELADSIMFPICFFGTACSFRIFPEPQELTHVLICT